MASITAKDFRSGTLTSVSNNLQVVDSTNSHFTTAVDNYFLRWVTVYDSNDNLKGFATVQSRLDDDTLRLETPFVFPTSDEDGTLETVTVAVGDKYRLSYHILDASNVANELTNDENLFQTTVSDQLLLGTPDTINDDNDLQVISLAGTDIEINDNSTATWIEVRDSICFTGRLVDYENLTTNYHTKIQKTVTGGRALTIGSASTNCYMFCFGLINKARDSDVLIFGGDASWGVEDPQRIYACNIELENSCVASRSFAPWPSNNDRKIIINCKITSRSTHFFMFSRFGQSVIGGNTVFEVVEPADDGVSAVYGLNGNFNTTFGLAGDDRVVVRNIFGTASELAFMRTSSSGHTQTNTVINHVTPITNAGFGHNPGSNPNNNITNTFQFINNFDNLNDKTRVIIVRTDTDNTISSISSGVATADGQRLQVGDSAFSVTGATTTTIETQWRQCVYSFNTVPNTATIDEVDVSLPGGTAKDVVFGGFYNQALDPKVVGTYANISAYTTLETTQKAYDYFRYLLGESNNTLRDHFVLNSNDFRMDIEGDIFDGKSHSIYMATAFDSSQAYTDNQVVYHNSRLYQADGAVTAGSFNSSDWDELVEDIAHFDSDGNLYFYYGTGNFTGSIKTSDDLVIVDDSEITGTIETSAGVVINLTVPANTVIKGNYGDSNTAIAKETVGSNGKYTTTVPADTTTRLAVAPPNSRARYIEYDSASGISDTPVFNAIPNTVNTEDWTNDISASYSSSDSEVTVSFSTLADITNNRFESTDAPTLVSTIQQTDGYLDALLDKEDDGYLTNNDNNDIIMATGLNWDFVLANAITDFLTMGLPIRTEGTATFTSTANTNNRIVIRALDSAITFNYNDVKALTDATDDKIQQVYEFLPTINKSVNNIHDEITGNEKQVLTVIYGDGSIDAINGYTSGSFGKIGSGSSSTITIYSSEFTLSSILSEHTDTVDTFELISNYFTTANNFSGTNRGILSNNFITVRNYSNFAQSVDLQFNDAIVDTLNNSLIWSNVPTWLSQLEGSDDPFNAHAITLTFHENEIDSIADTLGDIKTETDKIQTIDDNVDTIDTVVDRIENTTNKNQATLGHMRTLLSDVDVQDINVFFAQDPEASSIRGFENGEFGSIGAGTSATVTIYSADFTLTEVISQHTNNVDTFHIKSSYFTTANNFSATNKGILSGLTLRVQNLVNSAEFLDLEFDDATFDDLNNTLTWSNVPNWLSEPDLSDFGFALHMTFHESSFDSLKQHIEAVETKVDTVDNVVDSIKTETDKIQTVDNVVDSIKTETDKIQTLVENLEDTLTEETTITAGKDQFANIYGLASSYGSISIRRITLYDTAFDVDVLNWQSSQIFLTSNEFTSANGFTSSDRGFLAGESVKLSSGSNEITLNFNDATYIAPSVETPTAEFIWSNPPSWLLSVNAGDTLNVTFENTNATAIEQLVKDVDTVVDRIETKVDTIDTVVDAIKVETDKIQTIDDNVDTIDTVVDRIEDKVDDIANVLEDLYTETVTITAGKANLVNLFGYTSSYGSISEDTITVYSSNFDIASMTWQSGSITLASTDFTTANGFTNANAVGFLADESVKLRSGSNEITLNFNDADVTVVDSENPNGTLVWTNPPSWLLNVNAGDTLNVTFDNINDGSLHDLVHDIDENVKEITALIEDDAIKSNTVQVLGDENLINVPSGNVV